MSRHGTKCAYTNLFSFQSNNVGTSAWVTLDPSLSHDLKELEIFSDAPNVIALAIGPAGSEATQVLIFPNGNLTKITTLFNQGMRLSIKALTGSTITTGNLAINGYY